MNNTFFLGTFPGLTKEMIDYAEGVLDTFITERLNDSKEIQGKS